MNRKRTSIFTRQLVITAMLITMASILHVIEGALPPIPVTGAKLGLANIITVVAMVMLGTRTAFVVAVGRTVLGSLFGTGIISVGFAMSFSGAISSWLIMAVLYYVAKNAFSLVGLSLAGAAAHNLAQLYIANIVLENIGVFGLLPLLMFFAVPTGIMVGTAAGFLIRALEKTPQFQRAG